MKVSVCMIAYNREAFIGKAIEGVLMQEGDFEIELVIGEDKSTDRTRDICIEYKNKYPDKITLLLNESNIGLMKNYVKTLEVCNGEYLAICDCDDYWTDPKKLTKQVSFLEQNPDFMMCFHKVTWINEKDEQLKSYQASPQKVFTIKDLAIVNFIPNLSVVYRNNHKVTFPKWYFDLVFPDWPLHLFLAEYGKIYFFDEFMGAYRFHSTNTRMAKGKLQSILSVKECAEKCNSHFNYKYNSSFKVCITRCDLLIAKYYLSGKEYLNYGKYLLKTSFDFLQCFHVFAYKGFKKLIR